MTTKQVNRSAQACKVLKYIMIETQCTRSPCAHKVRITRMNGESQYLGVVNAGEIRRMLRKKKADSIIGIRKQHFVSKQHSVKDVKNERESATVHVDRKV